MYVIHVHCLQLPIICASLGLTLALLPGGGLRHLLCLGPRCGLCSLLLCQGGPAFLPLSVLLSSIVAINSSASSTSMSVMPVRPSSVWPASGCCCSCPKRGWQLGAAPDLRLPIRIGQLLG